MRFCRLRKKKGGGNKEFKFEKPSTKFSSSGQALENYNKQQDIQNKADSAALQKGGNKTNDEITVPTMGDNPEGNASIRTAVSGLAKSDADGEYDTPPPVEGGGRRRTRRRKKRRRTRRRKRSRHRTRRKKNRKKRTRRGRGKNTPPRKKKTPKPVVSPPSKRKSWTRKFTPTLKTPAREFYAVSGKKPDPKSLLSKTRGPSRHVPTTKEAKDKAVMLLRREKMANAPNVFKQPKGGKRKKTRRKKKRRKRKTRK